MAVSAKNGRNPGLDLLRAISMFFVICQHMIGQGGLIGHAAVGSGKFFFLSFLQILVYCAVDIYGITTGYLLCDKKFRLSRLVKLWLTTVFWSVAVSCCFFVLVPESRTFEEAVSMFLPILRGRYWFFTAYFVVMLVSPALNVLIRSLSRRQFQLLFAALLLIFGVIPVGSLGYDVPRISTGHHFSWMIALYLIGGYIKMHSAPPADTCPRKKKTVWLLGYLLCAAVHFLYKFAVVSMDMAGFGDLMLTYPSPLILGEAVCLFLYFEEAGKHIHPGGIAGKLLAFAAPGVYAVYVIHVHPKVFWSEIMIALFRPWDHWGCAQVLCAMVVTALGVFAMCVLLDKGRQGLFRLLHVEKAAEQVSAWIEKKVRQVLAD